MRYSIMLQVVGIITLILVGTAGLFAWLQNREVSPAKSYGQVMSNGRGGQAVARTHHE
jgi:hypothetical protein